MDSTLARTEPGFLDGQILIAMPGMRDPRFQHSLVYLCAHSEDGAMGLIINKAAEQFVWKRLFDKLDIPIGKANANRLVHYGGPVETRRGFVLHSADFHAEDATMKVDATTSMTETIDVLQAIALGKGPDQAVIAFGYSGWAPGQLESELQMNGWLLCPPDADLLYDTELETKWDRALAKIGVDPRLLSTGGHA